MNRLTHAVVGLSELTDLDVQPNETSPTFRITEVTMEFAETETGITDSNVLMFGRRIEDGEVVGDFRQVHRDGAKRPDKVHSLVMDQRFRLFGQ